MSVATPVRWPNPTGKREVLYTRSGWVSCYPFGGAVQPGRVEPGPTPLSNLQAKVIVQPTVPYTSSGGIRTVRRSVQEAPMYKGTRKNKRSCTKDPDGKQRGKREARHGRIPPALRGGGHGTLVEAIPHSGIEAGPPGAGTCGI